MNTRDAINLPRRQVRTIVAAVTRAIGWGTIAEPETWLYGGGEHWRYELDARTALGKAMRANAWETKSGDDRDYIVFRNGFVTGARQRVERDLLIERLDGGSPGA